VIEDRSTEIRGDKRGASAHERWLALVSVENSKTRINWRSPALAGAGFQLCEQVCYCAR